MGYYDNHCNVSELLGKTLTEIINYKNDEIRFVADDMQWVMYHRQDCCENVRVEDICGDLSDLIGSPILVAEEVNSEGTDPISLWEGYVPESYTWTFYKISTIKGSVTIRWYGTSNGYYSESVSFRRD